MGANWLSKAFQPDLAKILERESLAQAKLCNRIRNQNLFRQCMAAEASGKLNGTAKKIIVCLDWLAGSRADSNLQRVIQIASVHSHVPLDLRSTFYRGGCR